LGDVAQTAAEHDQVALRQFGIGRGSTAPSTSPRLTLWPGDAEYVPGTWTNGVIVADLQGVDAPGAPATSMRYAVFPASTNPASVPDTTVKGDRALVTIDKDGASILRVSAVDARGTAEPPQSVRGLNVDRTPPTVSVTTQVQTPTGVTPGKVFNLGQTVRIQCLAKDQHGLSTDPNQTCVDSQQPAYSFGPGNQTIQLTAKDAAGNVGVGSASITVNVDATSLCELTGQLAGDVKLATSVYCGHLKLAETAARNNDPATRQAEITAYQAELTKRVGKPISADDTARLSKLADGIH
jgi:hypothetical protein